MKKIFCLLLAVLLLAALAACGRDDGQKPSNTDTAKVPGASHTTAPDGDSRIVDNSVYYVKFDGLDLVKGDFDWQFFLSKVEAGIDAEIMILAETPSGIKLAFKSGAYTVTGSSADGVYAHLVTFNYNGLSGNYRLTVVTNDKGMTAEKFFTAASAGVAVGTATPNGVVVYSEKLK